MENWTEHAVYWLPLVVLIAAWLYFFRQIRRGPNYIQEINERFGKQNEEIIALLREIKSVLENRRP
jgi:3-deoxy-D-manno-octulosonic-acid transferase